MKVKELIKELKKTNPENKVYIYEDVDKKGEAIAFDFTGVSFDDLGDCILYVAGGDKEA